MKLKHLIALPLLWLGISANAQETNFSIGINSGRFSYQGDQVFAVSADVMSPVFRARLLNDLTSRSGFSYEGNATVQRITKTKFIFGGELAYQSFKSKSNVSWLSPSVYASALLPSEGYARSTTQYICATPFIGYRVLDKKVKIDMTMGVEMSFAAKRTEEIDARLTVGTRDEFKIKNDVPKTSDYRVRMQLNTSIGRWGLTTGFADGLRNYYKNDDFFRARARFIRVGLNYRIL